MNDRRRHFHDGARHWHPVTDRHLDPAATAAHFTEVNTHAAQGSRQSRRRLLSERTRRWEESRNGASR
jgi:hypothetical protein